MARSNTVADGRSEQLEEIAGHFRSMFATTTRKLPLYRRICEAAASDREVLTLTATARPQQQRPVLVLAAAHDALLAGAEHPLARWYGSVTPQPAPVGEPGSADDPWPAFRDLVLTSEHVAEAVATRSTQTNEVNRCGALLPALSLVAATTGRPLGLVELGTSAGLNLLFDRYSYDYGSGGRLDPAAGPSTVEVRSQNRGPQPVPVPVTMPAVASLVGVDLEPVDLTDAGGARWLVACLWPEQPHRLERVRNAIEFGRRDPPNVVQGDLVDTAAPLAARVAGDAEPVLFATWVLTYLDPSRQAALLSELDRVGAERDLHLVFAERLDEVPALPAPGRQDGADDPNFTALVWVRWHHGERTATRLGDMHPHATWLAWTHPGAR